MVRQIAIAACQMDVALAAKAYRIERAAALIEQAASDGAELVVLPELFNTGYAYGADIFAAAETMDGPSVDFLVDRAQRYGIIVAGSLLVRQDADVFNALVLAGRDGHVWRYDKVYPWAWERSVFRGSRQRAVVADTELGRIGMLVCWDAAHPQLWAQYAGRTQLILASSCPVDASGMWYRLEDGRTFHARDLVGARGLQGSERELFGEMVPQQAAWLGTPVVNTGGCGRFATALPRGAMVSAVQALGNPRMWGAVAAGTAVELHGGATAATLVYDPANATIARLPVAAGETYLLSAVEIAAGPPRLSGPQPATRLPSAAYVLSDQLIAGAMRSVYASHQRGAAGASRPARSWPRRLREVLRDGSARLVGARGR